LNKEKYERMFKEEERRREFQNRLLENDPEYIYNYQKHRLSERSVNRVPPIMIEKESASYNNSKKNSGLNLPVVDSIRLPLIKGYSQENQQLKLMNVQPLPSQSKLIINKINIINSSYLPKTNSNSEHNNKSIIHKLHKSDENNINIKSPEISLSYSKKKSPYYFNDPKFSKIIDIKQKYNVNLKNIQANKPYVLNYFAINNTDKSSLEDYEIM
jgi:hypothetical protein